MINFENDKQPWNSVRNSTETVTFADGIKSIGNNAFEKITSLKTIEWKNIASIGNYSFKGCSGIETASPGQFYYLQLRIVSEHLHSV